MLWVRKVAVASFAIAVLATGCGATSENDVVARVDDVELDRDTFTQLVNEREAANGNPVDGQSDVDAAHTTGEIARAVASQFVTVELVRADMTALGIAMPEIDSSLTGVARLDAEYQAIGQTWPVQPTALLADDQLEEWYAQGPTDSGVACVQHILVAEESQANAALDRLEAGEAFEDVAFDTSLDTDTAGQGGAVGCQPLSAFSDNFVDGALHNEFGVPSQPVKSQLGYHVLRVMPFEELNQNDVVVARLIALGQWHDVVTDPEIGAWTWVGIEPLG